MDVNNETATEPLAAESLAEMVREIYLERASGVVEIDHASGTESLFFRRGELYLDRDHRAARRISPLLAESLEEPRPEALRDLRETVEQLARELAGLHAPRTALKDDQSMVVELIGPLPAAFFALELAVYGCNEAELIERLGGDTVRFRSTDQTPAVDQLPALDPEMAQVLVSLEQPASPAALLRGAGTNRLMVLRGLTKLRAVGLVAPVQDREPEGDSLVREAIMTPRLLEKFSQRIGEELAETPIDLTPDEHRHRVAELLANMGQQNHYELLDIDPKADPEAVFAAYDRLARRVHPRHAERLGLAGKEEVVRVLFERATEAYLTLSDPGRRASYNNLAGIHVDREIDHGQRQQEKRTIAAQHYRRSSTYLATMDYSQAIDLLKEATRMDPRPEYFARLGHTLAKNPNWHSQAESSFQRAIELDPKDPVAHAGYGALLEAMERPDEAREEYKATLEMMPDNIEARAGLDRLGGAVSITQGVTSDFRSLFGKRGSSSES